MPPRTERIRVPRRAGASEHLSSDAVDEGPSVIEHPRKRQAVCRDGSMRAMVATGTNDSHRDRALLKSVQSHIKQCVNADPPCNLSRSQHYTLRIAADAFVGTRYEVEGSRGTRDKSPEKIERAWLELFQRRRRIERDDGARLPRDQVTAIWNEWRKDWLDTDLRPDQRWKSWNEKASLFNSWAHRNYGSKHMLHALLETGVSRALSQHLIATDPDGAKEHDAKHFVLWLQEITEAIHTYRGRGGECDTGQGAHLEKRLLTSKGKGKGGYRPLRWEDASHQQRWWLEQCWAERQSHGGDDVMQTHGSTVQARPFSRVGEATMLLSTSQDTVQHSTAPRE